MSMTDEQRTILVRVLVGVAAVLILVLISLVFVLSTSGPSDTDREKVKSFFVTVCCRTEVVSKVRERYDAIRDSLRGGNMANAKDANEAVASIIRAQAAKLAIPKELLVQVAESGGAARHEYANEIADTALAECPERGFRKDEVKRAARSMLKMIDWKLFEFK